MHPASKINRIAVPPLLRELASIFNAHGKQVFLVGGAVRDTLRGEKCADWDLAGDALPEDVMRIFPGVIPTGIKHGTVTIRYKKHSIEVTTLRTDGDYSDGRRPDSIHYTSSIEEDLCRRDFSINAVAVTLPDGYVIDPFGGRVDIEKNLIRCVGRAADRLNEDGLRALRAFRFASQLGFDIDGELLSAITERPQMIIPVSMERVKAEFDKIVASKKPSSALLYMERCGILKLVLPELLNCRGVEQKGYHRFDVLTHSLLACDYAARSGYKQTVRLAALFHDVGKPATAKLGDGGVWTFHSHETLSADITRAIMTRLRYPNAGIEETAHLVREHMFNYTNSWSASAVRRFVRRVGEENLTALFDLRRADSFGMLGTEPPPELSLDFRNRIDSVLAAGRVLSRKDLAVSGRDLMEAGIPGGEKMGRILNSLLEAVLEDPEMNSKEKLLEMANRLFCRCHFPLSTLPLPAALRQNTEER
ncbi:MAG: HD domain-containing protein [Spirochaetaceae bacterium]|jgi:putative nucleotidyltransferase with HDIG domain|nr:HD domain-containing protein [Spirochaetaceae bacterium]